MSDASPSPQRLAEVLGHELRNPLAAAIAGVTVLGEMTDDGDPRARFVGQVMRDLYRVSALLDSYLVLGRSSEVRRTPLDLRAVIHDVVDRYRPRPLGLEFEDDASLSLRVMGDEVLLARVFENLLENALAAGAKQVVVAVRSSPNGLRVEVRDDGPGIAEDRRESVFEPHVSGCQSTGLGLALVRQVVTSHGGDIRIVDSEVGTTFVLGLPT